MSCLTASTTNQKALFKHYYLRAILFLSSVKTKKTSFVCVCFFSHLLKTQLHFQINQSNEVEQKKKIEK